jgi:hypothetical protein
MILLYSQKETERLRYITRHVLDGMLGIASQICTDRTVFDDYQGAKINYAEIRTEHGMHIIPHGLLFEEDIRSQNIEIETYQDTPLCFRTQAEETSFLFDVFAACFFFLSRYEEYLPYQADSHQRYDESNSLAFRHHFLHLCVVERWIALFAAALHEQYPDLVFAHRQAAFMPTYDVDSAWSCLHKGVLRNMAGYVRSFFKFDFKQMQQRTAVLFRRKQDPFDTFDYLSGLHQQYALRPCYFFLAAQKRSSYDKNTNPHRKSFRDLVRRLATDADIGLHASYFVKEAPERLRTEIHCLQAIVERPITKNRHHYLRFSLPESYRFLASAGIEEEYSMGYVRHIGFRAGSCHPFLFFDLQENKATEMWVYPLLCMENALRDRANAEDIVACLLPYIAEIKRHRGVLVTLFHNESFGNAENGDKWKHVYEQLLTIICEKAPQKTMKIEKNSD